MRGWTPRFVSWSTRGSTELRSLFHDAYEKPEGCAVLVNKEHLADAQGILLEWPSY